MIECNNEFCKHNGDKNRCKLEGISIGRNTRCKNFEKGFVYYFYYLLFNSKSNFITDADMNEDMKWCIYYLMKCLPIAFSHDYNRGIIVFVDTEQDKQLMSVKEIYDMLVTGRLDETALSKCIKEFELNGLPVKEADKHDKNVKTKNKEYGWLSPTGEFKESPWGTHEETAEFIVEKKGWGEEYNWWLEKQEASLKVNYRDFLIYVKNYALIHSPSSTGYVVTKALELTKKQRDFLYGYFLDMGDMLRAEAYLTNKK